MSTRARLTILSFMEFFIWGSWLITIGAYWFQNRQWSGAEFGAIFSTMGLSAIFMPAITGVIADRFINAERLLGICHLLGAAVLLFLPEVNDPSTFFWVILLYMLFYMPTISLANTVSYTVLVGAGKSIVTDFPPIRVWGTIGFIVAMWIVSLLRIETSALQFYVVTLPACPPRAEVKKSDSFVSLFGLQAFSLFKDVKMALFFIFAMLLGAALQLTNAYGDTFLHDFDKIETYQNSIAVQYPAIIMSISQMSETLFILAIPFFLKRFGIKRVMLISMIAWVFRFGLFAYGNPGEGLWMIVLSCIVYGMAFDFFNISGSLFVDTQVKESIRASAQGIFMMMSNGFGAWLGSTISGLVIQNYFTNPDQSMNWKEIWLSFAGYSLVVALLFAVLFRHRHEPTTKAS